MVNINEIKTIEDAKNAIYNGKRLSNSARKIFDSPLLRKGEREYDLDKLHKTAILLDRVKRTKKTSELSKDLLEDLLKSIAKDKNSITAYQIINMHKKQVDKIIRICADRRTIPESKRQGVKVEVVAPKPKREDKKIPVILTTTNPTIDVDKKTVIRTKEQIESEIAIKEKELGTKNMILDLCIKGGNKEGANLIKDEITQLEREIKELKRELEIVQSQSRIEVVSK